MYFVLIGILLLSFSLSVLVVTEVIFNLENTAWEFLVGISILSYFLYLILLYPFGAFFEFIGLVKTDGGDSLFSFAFPEISIYGLALIAIVYSLCFYLLFFAINKFRNKVKKNNFL